MDAGLPNWATLVETTAIRFAVPLGAGGMEGVDYPAVLARCRANAAQDEEFWDFVAALVCGGSPGRLHRLLVRLPYSVLATTNLDCLLDQARLEELGETAPAEVFPDIRSTRLNGGVHAYLHGRCRPSSSGGDALAVTGCVLSTEQYDDAYGGQRLPHAIKSLFLDYPVLFVGTSFTDHDIQRLLTEVGRIEAEEARAGATRGRHGRYALVEGSADEVDVASPLSKYRVEPIRFLNPTKDFGALVDILDWLASATPPRPKFGGTS